MSFPVTGQGLERVDARLKVTGRADYAVETAVANVAHAVIVSSTVAKGRVAAIDTSAALRVPGVLAVLTHDNAPRLPGATRKSGPVARVLQLLQDDRVFYSDQPIALVIADTLERAQQAAASVIARYDAEPPVMDFDAELARAYTPHSAGPGGKADVSRGDDVGDALSKAHARVEATYRTPVETHNPMEMHGTLAVWQGDDRLTVYDASQGIFGVRNRIATVFDLPRENVRVISHYVGGGFGSKGTPWSHVALAVMGAKVVGRAVKLVVTRQQMFALVGHRPQTLQKVSLGADATGKLVAIEHTVISETSSFDEFVEPSAVQTRMLYACPNVSTSHKLVRLDVPTPTFTRAPGESTGTFALESAMDELSYALGMDPIALRLASYADVEPEEGKPWSSKSLRECYRVGAERFGWSKRHPAPRSMRRGSLLVGQGMATATYPARQSASSALARMKPDGTAVVQAGSQDIGTGTYTIMTQIAADALGLPPDRVRFELGDTAMPETPVSGGSQTASSTGSAVKRACLALRSKLVDLAVGEPRSPLAGLDPATLEVDDGAVFVRDDPGRRDAYATIVSRSGPTDVVAQVKNEEKAERKRYATHSFGAQLAEVTVDELLGTIRVTRMTGVFGAGKILNAKTARSQLQGGMIWGIGMALFESTWRDPRSGRTTTRDLADYHVPVNADVPDIEIVTVAEDDPHVNEIGAKGIGEIGITGAAAAIANAVYHATGKRVRELPITLDALL